MDGDHPIERCEEVTNAVLESVFDHLFAARIVLEGMVLKPNMVIAGKKSAKKSAPEQVAEATLRTLKRHVPSAVPGIAFLSGGQSPAEATLHLSLMNAAGSLPWALTFSYGRALQDTRCAPGAGPPRASRAGSNSCSCGRSSTAWPRRVPTSRRWKPPRRDRIRAAQGSRQGSTSKPRHASLNTPAAIVEIRDLHYAVSGRPIFDGLDVDIAPGRITADHGPERHRQDDAAAPDHRAAARRLGQR